MSAALWPTAFTRELRAALGPQALDPRHGVVLPRDREGVRRAVELLHAHRIAWRPVGRAGDAGEGLHLSTQGLDGILDLWREDLVARIGAGCTLGQAQRRLAPLGLRVPSSTPHPDHDSLGLLFATGKRGWRSGANRGLRESALGLGAVDGIGRVLKGGGRVVKNVAGYDLVRLHHGAAGAFGILTDLVVKLEVLPESAIELAIPCPAEDLAVTLEGLRAPARSLDPVAQLWCDPGAARLLGLGGEGALLLEVEGRAPAVEGWRGEADDPGAACSIQELMSRIECAAAWHGRWQLGARRILEEGASRLAKWRAEGFGIWMVTDLLGGGAELFAEDAAEPLGSILDELLALGGRIHSAAGRPDPAGTRRERPGPTAERLKQAFDPEGLLPPLPMSLERRR